MNQVYDISLSAQVYKEMIMKLSTSLVWKDTTQANMYEDSMDLPSIEIFMMANKGLLSFEMINKFPRYVYEALHISDDNINLYMSNKNNIPVNMQEDLVKIYQESLSSINPDTGKYGYNVPKMVGGVLEDNYIETYVEKNVYYRMLMGLPSKTSDYIYNDKRLEWGFDTPIHDMPLNIISDMEKDGYLDTLIKDNPDKKYLKFLGNKAINYFTARSANRFDILSIDTKGVSDAMVQDFIAAYKRSSQLVNDVYYNDAFRNNNKNYDAFLAMCVLFMTIQLMNSKYLEADITRDFYDTESLKVVYDSYGVPFYKDIPLDYHKRIVKNINKLISYKGTNQVFFDLFSIFDLGSMTVFGYYLIKTHKMNADGSPVFIYDEHGNLAEDQSGAYNIAFASCELGQDPSLHISDPNNIIKYEDIISMDPYWHNDKDLLDKLHSKDFNYVETKYIGVRSVFDLMEMTYENAYAIKMIFDMKKDTKGIMVSLGSIVASVFDTFIYLGALYCKAKGWEGIISTEASTIYNYLGYNFNNAMASIKNIAGYNEYLRKDRELMRAIKNISTRDIHALNNSIKNIPKLRHYIVDCMHRATDLNQYRAYRQLYDVLMISKYISGVFDKNNEDTTFAKVLSESSPVLYSRYTHVTDIVSEVDNIIFNLRKQLFHYKHLNHNFDSNTSLIDSLFKILNFFKSAKAELVSCNMVYMLTDRGLSFMKYMDKIQILTEIVSAKFDDVNLIDIMKWEKAEINKLASFFGIKEEWKMAGGALALMDLHQYNDEFITTLRKYLTSGNDDLLLIDLEPICINKKYYTIVDVLINGLEYREELNYYTSHLFKDMLPNLIDLLKLLPGIEYKMSDDMMLLDLYNQTIDKVVRMTAQLRLADEYKSNTPPKNNLFKSMLPKILDLLKRNSRDFIKYNDKLDMKDIYSQIFEKYKLVSTKLNISDLLKFDDKENKFRTIMDLKDKLIDVLTTINLINDNIRYIDSLKRLGILNIEDDLQFKVIINKINEKVSDIKDKLNLAEKFFVSDTDMLEDELSLIDIFDSISASLVIPSSAFGFTDDVNVTFSETTNVVKERFIKMQDKFYLELNGIIISSIIDMYDKIVIPTEKSEISTLFLLSDILVDSEIEDLLSNIQLMDNLNIINKELQFIGRLNIKGYLKSKKNMPINIRIQLDDRIRSINVTIDNMLSNLDMRDGVNNNTNLTSISDDIMAYDVDNVNSSINSAIRNSQLSYSDDLIMPAI